MKIKIITIIFLSIVLSTKAQELYKTSSVEMIFSFSDVSENSKHIPAGMRYSFFFHLQEAAHYNFNNTFGFSIGLGIKNLGITPAPDSIYSHSDKTYYKRASAGATVNQLTKVKQRVYTLGLPIAFKVGNFNKKYYFFAGGEIEYSFHYKEKLWIDGTKKKSSSWFTNETTTLLPSVLAGVKLPTGTTIKFKWYLKNFINNNHSADLVSDGVTSRIKPYENIYAQLFYVSLAYTIEYKKPKTKPELENSEPITPTPKIDM